MKRLLSITAVALAASLAGGFVGALAFTPSATHAAKQPAITSVAAFGQCPQNALPLPSEAVARAADQARIQAPALYPGNGPAVVQLSARAPFAGPRGGEVKAQCGGQVFNRTVVVELFFPKMLPSASLSQGVVFVSRFGTGYKVWEIAH